MFELKTCLVCGKTIEKKSGVSYSDYMKKKFCSRECHHKHMRKEFIYKCACCGKDVIRTKEGITTNVFCNDICKGRHLGKTSTTRGHKERGERIQKECIECKKIYYVPNNRKNSKFCCVKCKAVFDARKNERTQKDRYEIRCTNCDNALYIVKSDIKEYNFCNMKCQGEYYHKTGMFAGENNGRWIGGKISTDDYGSNWDEQRLKTRIRDNYTCQICGVTEKEYGKQMSCHHIIYFREFNGNYLEANKLENLICLCEPCHQHLHFLERHN